MVKTLEAILLLSGMIIGVGMFGIPFSFFKVGFWAASIELIVLTGMITVFHLLYSQIVLRTASAHRLPGYIKIYLGNRAGTFTFFVALFSIVGSLLAYLLIGSLFFDTVAKTVFPASQPIFWVIGMVAAGAVFIRFPLGKEALINGILTAVLIGFLLLLSVFLLPEINATHFSGFHPEELLFPYGVLLFALSGGIAIPDLVALLKRDERKTRRTIVIGTLIPAALYFVFAFAVVGVSGPSVSEEALLGLGGSVPEKMILLGSAIGFLAVFTSYIILSSNFEALLRLDLGVRPRAAWLIPTFIPFLFYLLGFHNFLAIISLVGAVAGGIEAALVISAYHAMRYRTGLENSFLSYGWKIALFFLLTIGVVYELYKLY